MTESATVQSPSEILYKRILIAMLDKERSRILAWQKSWRNKNPEKGRKKSALYRSKNTERIKAHDLKYYRDNRVKFLLQQSQYRASLSEAQKSHKRNRVNQWAKKKCESDPVFRMRENLIKRDRV